MVANSVPDADLANLQYKLLFAGEVVGFSWTKNTSSRSLVLQCEDLSNYWDYAYQWSNDDIWGPGLKAVFSGGATNLFTDYLESKGSIITAIVMSGHCATFPKLRGLAAGIVRLIEAIGGTYFPQPGSTDKAVAGQNLFFSTAELRLHVTQMLMTYDEDPTTLNLLGRQGWEGLFNRALGSLGEQVSIRQAINALTKIIFHETYAQPCPRYIPGSDAAISGSKRIKLKDSDYVWITNTAQDLIDSIAELRDSMTGFDISEATNAGPSESGAEITKMFDEQATRSELGRRFTAIDKSLVSNHYTTPSLSVASTMFGSARSAVRSASALLKKWTPGSAKNQVMYAKLDEATAQLKRILDLSIQAPSNANRVPAQLAQQIFRPDIWFGPPPRCNVLFPESYDQLSYRRMFLQEPTRLLLKTNDEFFGEDELFDKYYFAPQAATLKGNHARMEDILKNSVMTHELFTGILPVFEKMGEFNIFADQPGKKGPGKGATAKLIQQHQGALGKVGLAQRSANFLYFKHRFNSRQMQIGGKFNPYVAVGFPGLAIDKYMDVETIRLLNELRSKRDLPEQEINETAGTNFIGNFTMVSHTVGQEQPSGHTEIVFSYPRQPEESVEFIGAFDDKQTLSTKDGSSTRTTKVAAINPPKLFTLGPNAGRITNVVEITASVADTAQTLPLFDFGALPDHKEPVLVPVGVEISGEEYGMYGVLQEITGGRDVPVYFRAFIITEQIPRYKQQGVYLPAEELIRPGWYGDIWSPLQIGQAYQRFFATSSITDEQVITGPGSAFALGSEEAHQAEADHGAALSPDDPRCHAPGALALQMGASIQQAVEFLVLTYSHIKQQGFDTDEFIRAYTWRPIATMVDIFGTSDLEYSADGSEVLSGIEGFHSKAFGQYDNLFGLVTPEIENILNLQRGSVAAQRADTRQRKWDAVSKYLAALRFSRAIIG